MSNAKKWSDRKFDFDFPAGDYPRFIARLRATADHIAALVGSLPESVLIRRDGESWSIQENVGHLGDVDLLFIARLEEYKEGAVELTPAEMSGKKTFRAGHNECDINSVLMKFREQREAYVTSLDALSREIFKRSAYHPRLKKEMRLCDMLQFQAEHDDYHIRRIEQLIAVFTV